MPTVLISMSPDGQFRVATAQPDESILATAQKFSDVQSALAAAGSMLAGKMAGSDMEAAGMQDEPDADQMGAPPDGDADNAMAQGFASARGPRRMMDDGRGAMR